MGRLRTIVVLAGAAALAISTGGCAKYDKADGKADAAAVKDALKADEKTWNDQFKSKDVEALVGHYANDAYFVAPGVKPASGSTEVRKAYANGMSDKNFAISFASEKMDVAASGDLAYARGRFTEKYTEPKSGKVMSHEGSYITVYKRQQDGSWKAVEDFAAADPDSDKPVEPEKPATRAKMVSF